MCLPLLEPGLAKGLVRQIEMITVMELNPSDWGFFCFLTVTTNLLRTQL